MESNGSRGARARSFPRYANNPKHQWRFGETTDDTERTLALARAVLRDGEVRHTSVGRELLTCTNATLAQGAVMVGAGLALGVALSLWAADALGGAGFGTGRFDVFSISVTAATLIVAGAAAVLPVARRAA